MQPERANPVDGDIARGSSRPTPRRPGWARRRRGGTRGDRDLATGDTRSDPARDGRQPPRAQRRERAGRWTMECSPCYAAKRWGFTRVPPHEETRLIGELTATAKSSMQTVRTPILHARLGCWSGNQGYRPLWAGGAHRQPRCPAPGHVAQLAHGSIDASFRREPQDADDVRRPDARRALEHADPCPKAPSKRGIGASANAARTENGEMAAARPRTGRARGRRTSSVPSPKAPSGPSVDSPASKD